MVTNAGNYRKGRTVFGCHRLARWMLTFIAGVATNVRSPRDKPVASWFNEQCVLAASVSYHGTSPLA